MPKHERMSRGWLKIGELARKLGIPATTVRYYTDIGILGVVAETPGGYRLYDQAESVQKVEAIRQARGKRPSLREAKAMVENVA